MTVLVSDSFNRADSTTTLGTTDSYNGGTAATWQYSNADTWGISINQAYQPVAHTTEDVAFIDASQSDNVNVSADSTLFNNSGVVFRYVDANNYFRAVITNYIVYLQRYVNGTKTTISQKSISSTSSYTLKVSLSGTSITVYVNGTSVITATDTNFTTATKYGLSNYNSTSNKFDNFFVESTATGTNATITSVIANTNASSLAPTVSTDNTITIVIASAQADALSPQVGSFTNTNINSVSANATASTINPNVTTTKSININASVPNAVASAIAPNVSPLSVQINALAGSLMASAISPILTIQNMVIGVLNLHGSMQSTTTLKGSYNYTIQLRGGI